jgi:hypothetical protein
MEIKYESLVAKGLVSESAVAAARSTLLRCFEYPLTVDVCNGVLLMASILAQTGISIETGQIVVALAVAAERYKTELLEGQK